VKVGHGLGKHAGGNFFGANLKEKLDALLCQVYGSFLGGHFLGALDNALEDAHALSLATAKNVGAPTLDGCENA
jgi:hypothetical protein